MTLKLNAGDDPPVPRDANLRHFRFLPLDVARLRDSGTAAKASGDGFRAAVLLWCVAWHQVPAGSLPDDDAELANLAGYGRMLDDFLTVRAEALRGFVKLSDGRLYHPVVCERVLEALKVSHAAKAGAQARWSHKKRGKQRNPGDAAAEPRQSRRNAIDRIGEDKKGLDQSALSSGSDLLGETTLETVAAANGNSRFELPKAWTPSPTQREYARKLGLTDADVDREALKFVAFFTEGRGADERRNLKEWRGSWHSWVDKAANDRRAAESEGVTDWSIYRKDPPAGKAVGT